MPPGVDGSALLTGENRENPVTLSRAWGDALLDEKAPYSLWIRMNPSGADADRYDLTTPKEGEWTQRLGLCRYVKVNVGNYRSTDPAGLDRAACVSHPRNLPTIILSALVAKLVILTTGRPPEILVPHARTLFRELKRAGIKPLCLSVARGGWPKHSSRLGYDTPMVEFAL